MTPRQPMAPGDPDDRPTGPAASRAHASRAPSPRPRPSRQPSWQPPWPLSWPLSWWPLSSLWTITLAFAALHLALAALVPLVEDETYYALWASVPAWGYYDHPPMIAWWIAAGEALLGRDALGVRLLSVLAFAAVTPMTWRIAQILSGGARDAAWRAALYVNATAVIFFLGFTATPDAPSVFFWTLTLWAMLEALADRGRRARWWLLAGLAAGLGVQSKFTNLFLGVGIVVWLVATREGRQALRRPAVWGAAAVALAAIAPLVVWNWQHGWIGLARQFGRIEARALGLRWLLDYLLGTFVMTTPLIGYAALRGLRRPTGPGRLIWWLTAPLALYMVYHALHAKVQPNWLAPLYPAFAVFAALYRPRRPTRFAALAAGSGAALSALALALALWPGRAIFPGHNPPNQTKGWPAALARIETARRAAGAGWIATARYGLTGSLWWYLPAVPVWSVTGPQRYLFRPAFPPALCAAPGLLVTRGAPPPDVLARFARHGPTRYATRTAGSRVLERYGLTPVEGPGGSSFSSCAIAAPAGPAAP